MYSAQERRQAHNALRAHQLFATLWPYIGITFVVVSLVIAGTLDYSSGIR